VGVRTILAYAGMCAIWGTTWLAIKIGLQSLPIVTGVGIRFFIAAIFLWLLAHIVPGERGERAPWRTILILTVGLFGGNYVLVYFAETGLASGLVAVLFGTVPFWIFAFANLMLGERVTVNTLIGAAIALAGVAAISISPDAHGSLPFVLAALASAAMAAYANVELKRHAATDPFRTLPPAMLISGVALTVAGVVFERPDWSRALEPRSVAAVLYLAILGSGVAFYLNQLVLQRLPAWVVGLSALILPVIAVAVGALLGAEAFGPRELAGAALVLVGVWLALLTPRRASEASA
jgi:drug/metabolite transporter (DMT)-like permease